MSDMHDELTLEEAANVLPRIRGKKIHLNTLKRWIAGNRRGVRLEAWKRGGRWFTSRAALEKYRQECSAASGRLKPRTPAERSAAIAAARQALRENGFYGRQNKTPAASQGQAAVPALST